VSRPRRAGPSTTRSRCAVGILAVALATAVVACGGDGGDDADRPLVGEIAPAVEALEAELGDAPHYFEIRATPLTVTLWVSADQGHRAIPYPYADGELGDPGGAQVVEGGYTFTAADALGFAVDGILDQVADDLDAPLTQFSIVGTASGEPRYTVTAQSERGGELDIQVDADGTPLEAVPID
jgi:hypothetical protein